MSLREEIKQVINEFDNNVNDDIILDEREEMRILYADKIVSKFEKRIDRIIEEELERMLIQGHTFFGEPTVTEIPVDKVKEMLK